MSWNDVLLNENFQALGPEGKREKADLYFEKRIEPLASYKAADKKKQQDVRVRFLSTIGQQPDEIGGFFAPLRRGLANTAAIQSGMLELMATWAPEGVPMFGREDLEFAAEFWRERFKFFEAETGKTGAYTQAARMLDIGDPTSPYSPLNPKRAFNVISEGLPLLGAFIGAHLINPIFGKLVMIAAEGGDAAQKLREYEEETGTKVPDWQRKLIPMTVGIINAKLEALGIETMLGQRFSNVVKGKLMQVLFRAGAEGAEEFVQEGIQILGEAAYGKPHQAKQVLSDLFNAFYGGVLLGGVVGGAVVPFQGVKGPVEETIRAEDLPPGLRAGPMAAQLQDLALLDDELKKDPKNEQLRMARLNAEASFAADWARSNPTDVDGSVMEQVLKQAGLEKLGKVIKRVRLTEELMDQVSFDVELPDGSILPVSREPAVSKTDTERVLTAIDWLASKAPKLMSLVQDVTIIKGAQARWLNGLSKAVTGMNRSKFIKEDAEGAARLEKDFAKAGSAIWTDAEGKVHIALRAKYEGAKQFKTSRYVNLIAHELLHQEDAVQDKGATEEFRTALEEETRAEAAGKEAAEVFLREDPELEFQEKPLSVPEMDTKPAPTMQERLRLEQGLGGLFTKIVRYEGTLFNDAGESVYAATNKNTGALNLAGMIQYNTIGHEGGELAIDKLGMDHPLVQRGLKEFGGNKEALLDTVGQYYADTLLEKSLVTRIGTWLKELWAEFQNVVGADLAQEQIVALLNRRMRRMNFGPVTNKLRVFDKLDSFKPGARINLDQLPMKGIGEAETAYAQMVATKLRKQKGRVVKVEDFKAVLVNDLVEVRIETEQAETELIADSYTVGEFNPDTHVRLMFETPIDFEMEAHEPSGIKSTTAIGWAEVAEPVGDFETLIVFEVQPSDVMALKQVRFGDVKRVGKFPSEETGRLNQFMYRALIQDAARKGYKKIRFPVGETVKAIEGTAAPVELYNKIATRIEQEWKGRTERITVGEDPIAVRTFAENQRLLRTALDALKPGDKTEVSWVRAPADVEVGLSDATGLYYGSLLLLSGRRLDFSAKKTGAELHLAIVKELKRLSPRLAGLGTQWLEVSLLPEDGTNGALRFQRVKFYDVKFTQRPESPKQEARRKVREDYRAHISLRNADWRELYKTVRDEVYPKMPAKGTVEVAEMNRSADIFLADPQAKNNALALAHKQLFKEGLTSAEQYNLSRFAIQEASSTLDELFHSKEQIGLREAMKTESAAYWIDVLKQTGAEQGRNLRFRREFSDFSKLIEVIAAIDQDKNLSQADLDSIDELARSHKWNLPQAAKELSEQILEKQARAKPSTISDHVWSVFHNSILFGAIPVNLFSNVGWLAWLLTGEHATMAAVETGRTSALVKTLLPKLGAPAQKAFFGDIGAMWYGVAKGPLGAGGLGKAFRTAGRVFLGREDIPEPLKVKWKKELGPAYGAFARSPIAAFRTMAPVMEAVTDVLISTDIFFRSIAADAHTNMVLQRMARNSGLTARQVAEAMSKESFEALEAEAGKFGQMATFFDNPGFLANTLNDIKRKAPGPSKHLFQLIMPYTNTLVNILKRVSELTPVVGLTALKTDTDRARLAARQIAGATLTMALLLLFWDDERMTGAVPKNEAERLLWAAAKKQPDSFKVGNRWVSYRRLEPLGMVIGNIVAFRDAIKETAKEHEERSEEGWTDYFENIVEYVMSNMMRAYPAENLRRIIGEKGARRRFATRIPSSFFPFSSFFRSLARAVELVDDGSVKAREGRTILSQFAQLLPWPKDLDKYLDVKGAMPARITALGTEIELPAGGLQNLFPISWVEQMPEDSVEMELMRLEHYPGLPSQWLTVARREIWLPDDFYREYALLYGKFVKEALQKAMDTDFYRGLVSTERKIKFLDKRMGRARDRARKQAERRARDLRLDQR